MGLGMSHGPSRAESRLSYTLPFLEDCNKRLNSFKLLNPAFYALEIILDILECFHPC